MALRGPAAATSVLRERIDRGDVGGVTSSQQAELAAARRRIAELETELAIHRRAAEILKEAAPQKAVRGGRGDRR